MDEPTRFEASSFSFFLSSKFSTSKLARFDDRISFLFFFPIKIRLKFFDAFRFPFPENPMILRIFYTDVSKSISLEGEKISWREKIVAAAWWIKKKKKAASVKSKGRHTSTNFQLRGK